MPQTTISIEYLIALIIFAIALAAVALSNNKATPRSFEKMIRDYETLSLNCNTVANDIRLVIESLEKRVFVSVFDRDTASKLIDEFHSQFNDLTIAHNKVSFYLEKRNLKQYRRYKKQAERVLESLIDIFNKLQNISQYTQTIEEFENARKKHESSFSYEKEARNDEEFSDGFKEEPATTANTSANLFFSGCSSINEIEKRYRSLAKVYHPDMPTGDKETFQKILEEYEREKARL